MLVCFSEFIYFYLFHPSPAAPCLTRLHPTQLMHLYLFEIEPPHDEVRLRFWVLFLAPLHVTAAALRGRTRMDQVILCNLDEPCSSKQQRKSLNSHSASSNLCCQLGLLAAGRLRKSEVWSCNVKNTQGNLPTSVLLLLNSVNLSVIHVTLNIIPHFCSADVTQLDVPNLVLELF